MSTIREQLHALVDRLPQENEEHALGILRDMVNCPPPERETPDPLSEVIRRHLRQAGQRFGLDVDQLQNGGWTGGVVGNRVEVTKDWESEDARHRLSKIDVHGHDIILLERMEAVEGTEFRYEVRVLADQSEGRAVVNLPIGQFPSQ